MDTGTEMNESQIQKLIARNVELESMYEQQCKDIDEVNEKNRHWFDVMKQVVEVCSHDYDGLEKNALDEIKGLVKGL